MFQKSNANKLALIASTAILFIIITVSITLAAPSNYKTNELKVSNYNNAVENLLSEETSRNDEIADDLTAADLDLDGANASETTLPASTNNSDLDSDSDDNGDSDDSGDSTATDATENTNQLRWLDNNSNGSDEPHGLDSNIENARINMSPKDLTSAAGHHHHHGHYPHGLLKMGAETGKKGSFKWYDKHPVGGKGKK